MNGSICLGCGCTDECACEGGCSWLELDVGVGVCSRCEHALPAWDRGARLAGWYPEIPVGQQLLVQLGGRWVREYKAGAGLPAGTYYVHDDDRGTLRLVDEQGQPAVGPRDLLRIDTTTDWEAYGKAKTAEARRNGWLQREPTADEKRAEQRQHERRRKQAKAARKARQAQRRRS